MNGSNPSATPNFDNLLIQSLMGGLHTRAPPFHASPFSAGKSLEDLFSDMLLDVSDFESDSDNPDNPSSSSKTQLAKEEAKLEKEIIRTILSGEIEKLNPNSGQAVAIGGHHICVGFHEETGSDYRVWEWHGHIMLFDEENGYTPEYIYGNYFEKVVAGKMKVKKNKVSGDVDKNEKEAEEKVGNMGLKELIDYVEMGSSRILHRNLNASSGSPRF
ncbi:uncharacterized protein LOC142551808 [Primulina tabacum]|uniref:uncharacterized protein LOC142551808 n=1 Tax=Primulina tabacum TaxID=48773 RepID=UPI003F59B15A